MQVILSAYSSTSARSYPVSLVYSGWYTWYDGKTNDQNDLGSYYPALSYTQDIAYYLVLSSDSLAPRDATSKKRGFALRCNPTGSSAARSYPVSLVLSGVYFWETGQILYQNQGTGYLSLLSKNDSSIYFLNIYDSHLGSEDSVDKRRGLSLRWL